MFSRYVARRYLRSKLALTIVCVLGITLGVAVLNIVLSVMTGFSELLKKSVRGSLSDIIITSNYLNGFENYKKIIEGLEKLDGVEACTPRVEGFALALIESQNFQQPFSQYCRFIGIDPQREPKVSKFAEYVGAGLTREEKKLLSPEEKKARIGVNRDFKLYGREVHNAAIAGFDMINPYRLQPGDRIRIYTHDPENQPSSAAFTVVNTFKSGLFDYDSSTIYLTLEAAQRLRKLIDKQPDGREIRYVTNINVKVQDPRRLEETKDAIEEWLSDNKIKLGFDQKTSFLVRTWKQEKAQFLAAVELETNLMAVILMVVLVIACFQITSLLSLVATQKTHDIGILRAVGASRGEIMKIFVSYGVFVGLIGATLGLVFSALFIHYLDSVEALVGHFTGFKPFNREIYNFDRIPRKYDPIYMTAFWCLGVGAAILASLFPAYKAGRMHPIEALRYE